MGRPHKKRVVAYQPGISYFKPRGIPMLDLEEIVLKIDELEAIRLADLEGLSHHDAGQEMGVSRATFGRIIEKARKVVADAMINGKAINVEGGNYKISTVERLFMCEKCKHEWLEPCGVCRPKNCPACHHDGIKRTPSR